MKTYLKHPHEKSTAKVFYSPLNTPDNFPSRVDFRQRILQPSTKEQQRLLSTSSSPRLQHVHSGKYGIRPIWPSDESDCEQWQAGKKSRKNRWPSFASITSRSDRNQCVRSKSDLQKKFILPSTSTLSYVTQEDGSKLVLASVSLFLLLFLIVYIFYRRRCNKINENQLNEQRRRQSLEDNLLKQQPFEYHLSNVRKLPTIIEENPSTLSQSDSSNTIASISNSTNFTSSPTVTDVSDSRNSSSASLRQENPSPRDIDNIDKTVQKVLTPKEEQPVIPNLSSKVEKAVTSTPTTSSKEQSSKPNGTFKENQSTITDLPSKLEQSKSSTAPSNVEQSVAPSQSTKTDLPSKVEPSKTEKSSISSQSSKESQPAKSDLPSKVEPSKTEKSSISSQSSKESQPAKSDLPSKVEPAKASKPSSHEQSSTPNPPSKVEQSTPSKTLPAEQSTKSNKTDTEKQSTAIKTNPPAEQQSTTAKTPSKLEPSTTPKPPPSPSPKEQSTILSHPSKSEQSTTTKPPPKEQSTVLNAPSKSEQSNTSKPVPKEQSTALRPPSTIEPSNQRRRSRFEVDTKSSAVENAAIENLPSLPVVVRKTSITHEHVIRDDYASLEEINNAVKEVGLDHSQLIFGIDYTISNLETGKNSFNGLSLHHIQDGLLNPYQSVITIVGRTLEKFDSDTLIPVFGFGDRSTLDRKIFPLRPDGSYCKGFHGVLEAYNEITPKVRMSGPTNFAPLIREAVRIVKKTGEYHILVIVADGQVTNERQTKDAIVEASNYPLSIVMIGVGDGPWDMMEEFDDSLPTRQFDNFQFVEYNRVVEASANTDSTFALRALMEIPSQYAAIKELGLLNKKY